VPPFPSYLHPRGALLQYACDGWQRELRWLFAGNS
jgi:hypothetical protein